jgi:peptidoglycan/xylan/chitin deacetylase (PgdA/CDA1 family)
MYHSVSEGGERPRKIRATNPEYTLPAGTFRSQMQLVADGGCRTVYLQDLVNGTAGENSVALTFDDCLLDAGIYAVPILREKDLKATFFAVTDLVGREGYAGWDMLREMAGNGMSIQSHGASHEPLSEMRAERIRQELETSKKTIEDRLGTAVDFLSAPHGMFDGRVREAARSLGYRGICTSEPGYSHTLGTPAVIKRINVPDTCTSGRFKGILARRHEAICSYALAKSLKNVVKGVLGYQLYRKLYTARYRIAK